MTTTALPGISASCLHICPRALKPGANTECQSNMPGNVEAAMFQNFYYMLTHESLRHVDANNVIYDAEGAGEGRYGCT